MLAHYELDSIGHPLARDLEHVEAKLGLQVRGGRVRIGHGVIF